VIACLDVNPVDGDQLGVVFVSRLYGDLAAEGESASGFKREGGVSDANGLGIWFSHVDVEGHFLDGETFGLLHEELPVVLFLGLSEG
jgi:hypothetical protein